MFVFLSVLLDLEQLTTVFDTILNSYTLPQHMAIKKF